jgi:hypothetical protein
MIDWCKVCQISLIEGSRRTYRRPDFTQIRQMALHRDGGRSTRHDAMVEDRRVMRRVFGPQLRG